MVMLKKYVSKEAEGWRLPVQRCVGEGCTVEGVRVKIRDDGRT